MAISKTLLAVLLISAVTGGRAASPSIGFVSARGSFQLDNSRIWSNGTVFDGSLIETRTVPSQIHLSDGSQIQIAPGSRVRVFQNHAILEKGALQFQASTAFRVEARALNIAAGVFKTSAGIELRSANRVATSATSGEVLVTNKDKVLVAHVTPGKVVTLDTDNSSRPGMTRIAGCLQGAGHTLMLIDQASQLTFELHGAGVEKELGNRVAITGTAESASPKVPSASQAIKVVHVDRLEEGVCAAAGAVARHAGPIAAIGGAIAGISAAAGTAGGVAIIGGVTVAATVGGLEAAGTFSSAEAEAPPSTSR